jgi:hypothetical protein
VNNQLRRLLPSRRGLLDELWGNAIWAVLWAMVVGVLGLLAAARSGLAPNAAPTPAHQTLPDQGRGDGQAATPSPPPPQRPERQFPSAGSATERMQQAELERALLVLDVQRVDETEGDPLDPSGPCGRVTSRDIRNTDLVRSAQQVFHLPGHAIVAAELVCPANSVRLHLKPKTFVSRGASTDLIHSIDLGGDWAWNAIATGRTGSRSRNVPVIYMFRVKPPLPKAP